MVGERKENNFYSTIENKNPFTSHLLSKNAIGERLILWDKIHSAIVNIMHIATKLNVLIKIKSAFKTHIIKHVGDKTLH